MPRLLRQGDLLLQEATIPADATREEATAGPVILAHGEATGHAHVLDRVVADDVEVYTTADAADRWLRVHVAVGVAVRHQEHATVTLPPGDYRVVRQYEYDAGIARRVAD